MDSALSSENSSKNPQTAEVCLPSEVAMPKTSAQLFFKGKRARWCPLKARLKLCFEGKLFRKDIARVTAHLYSGVLEFQRSQCRRQEEETR